MSQLLNPPAPPESRKTMKPRIELIGTTGYAIRIQEDKSGQLIELHADGEEVLADIPESTLDNFAYTLNDDLGNNAMSQSFELRIIDDGTHSSDHSCLIGLRFDMADGYQEHMLNKTDLMNLRREIGRTLKELNQKKDKK